MRKEKLIYDELAKNSLSYKIVSVALQKIEIGLF